MRRERQTSGQLTVKSVSINDAKRKSDGCAQKADEITSGDLSCVSDSGLGESKGDPTTGQKSAEGKVAVKAGEGLNGSPAKG
jgi:hypothetical protein